MVDVARIVNKVVDPLRRRIQLAATRAVVNLIKNTGSLQTVQVSLLADQTADDVEHFQPYGFTSSPPSGAEAIVLAIGGNTDHLVAVVVTDRSSRFAGLLTKDSALYTDAGNRVHCKAADGSVAAVPTGSGFVHLGADAGADFVPLAADVLARVQALHDWALAHVHSGVTTGPGSTAVAVATVPPLAVTPASVAADKVKAT